MTLDRGQQIRMSLGGTQRLPAPGSGIGFIQWADSDVSPRTDDSLIEITFEKSTNHAVIWFVRAGDVKAVESITKVNDEMVTTWFVGPEVKTALETGALKGVAHVLEEAQTLIRLEHSVSVIDSVQVVAGLPTGESYGTNSNCNPC